MPDSAGRLRPWWPRPLQIRKEARREADRRAGELLISLLNEEGKADVSALLERGEFVLAVRRIRELTGLRLIDAKRLAESMSSQRGAAS